MVKLDYILAKPEVAALCADAKLWDDQLNGIYLSDHYPIQLTVDL
jgi:endonuclease/exonuclease/phosphatase family metal-dependent hydrolase